MKYPLLKLPPQTQQTLYLIKEELKSRKLPVLAFRAGITNRLAFPNCIEGIAKLGTYVRDEGIGIHTNVPTSSYQQEVLLLQMKAFSTRPSTSAAFVIVFAMASNRYHTLKISRKPV